MKKLPVPIIVSLIFLAFGYLYCAYFLVEKMINDTRSGIDVAILIILSLLTLFMIGAYAAVITRHSRSVLLLGMILFPIVTFAFAGLLQKFSLTGAIIIFIFLVISIIFIIWSNSINNNKNCTTEDIFIKKRQKYKYWLYSAIIFAVAGMSFGVLGRYFWQKLSRGYESVSETMYTIMAWLLFISLAKFVIYYIICKIRAFRAKKICAEKL